MLLVVASLGEAPYLGINMSDKYFVYINKKYYGPLFQEDITKLLDDKKISISTYIYDVNLKYVFMLGEHKNFNNLLPEKPHDNFLKQSYILIKDCVLKKIYTHAQLHDAISLNQISIYEYVYIPHKNIIKRIKDFPDLEEMFPTPPLESPTDAEGKNNIVLVKEDKELQELAPEFARRFPRAPFSAPTRIEYEGSKYIGNCSVIGEGGCFLELKNSSFKVGDILQLNIVSELIHLEIIVKGEVSSIVKDYRGGMGIKFVDLKEQDKKKILGYIDRYIDTMKI